MLDWLAVGWNLAMTVAGGFLVSLSFRRWPLDFSNSNAALHTLMTIVTVFMIGVYPYGLLHLPTETVGVQIAGLHSVGLGPFDSLIYVPLVTLMLAYAPGWALLAGLPTIIASLVLSRPGNLSGAGPLIAIVGTLLVAAAQKRGLNLLRFSDREAAWRLPLIFLPTALPPLLASGWRAGLLSALVLMLLNLVGFLTGTLVLRSRFRLLAASARLSRQALTDPLTGLWNRRQLEQDLAELPEDGHVLLVDLDYFKTINDRFGHDVGDQYLTSTAATLRRVLNGEAAGLAAVTADRPGRDRRTGSGQGPLRAYRMGGEEFALLLADARTESAAQLAETVMRQVREVRHRANPGGRITCSVGLAKRLPGEPPERTLQRADAALLQAKANGRDRLEHAGTRTDTPDTGLHVSMSRPVQPLLWEAIHASLSLAALDRDLTTDDWTRLLQAAILSVPTAESGTINIRQGSHFVLCAQIGFDDRLLDIRHTEREQLEWYGLGAEAWKRGQPRVLYGEDIAVKSDAGEVGPTNAESRSDFRRFGRITELQSSLCIPVLMDGEVVGHLNLDRSSDGRPFDAENLRVARAFADQVTVLTVAAKRREALDLQQRGQEWLLEFSLSLLSLSDTHGIVRRLLTELETRYALQGQLMLGPPHSPEQEQAPEPFTAARCILALSWPGQPHAHLVLRRDATFSPHEHRLMEQAARAASAAMVSLQARDGRREVG